MLACVKSFGKTHANKPGVHLLESSLSLLLDILCTGDNPRLNRYKKGRNWHDTIQETTPTV